MNTLSHFHSPILLFWYLQTKVRGLDGCYRSASLWLILLHWADTRGTVKRGLHVHYMIFIKTSALRLQFFHFFIHTCNVVILILATIYHTMICLITIKGHVSITYGQIAKLYFVCKLWKKMFILKKIRERGRKWAIV